MSNFSASVPSDLFIDPFIFREYDIRGTFETQLSFASAYRIAQAFGSWLNEIPSKGSLGVCVAHDGRLSSPVLADAVSQGLLSQGIDVVFLGLGPTPFLYWAETHLDVVAGLMITGSHNPPQDNGIKITFNKKPFFGEQIQELYHCSLNSLLAQTPGRFSSENLLPFYVENLLEKTPPCPQPLKVIWDPGNGAFGTILKEVTDRLPHASLILHEEVDGNFPNRSPDPTKPSALKKLTDTVLREQADIGFAFDGDGDRVVVVDHRGIPFAGDELLFVFASRLLSQVPQLKVVADIKCSPFLLRELEEKGAQVFVEKTGHVHIKKRMTTEGALLGGEVSGHFFFKDEHPGFDDGLYGALRILKFFAENSEFLKELRREIPQRYTSPEIRLSCQENEKNLIISTLKENLLRKQMSFRSLDGIQVIREKEWWLMRASQTEASLIVRFEAFDESSFHSLAKEIASYLAPWGISL